MLLIAIDGACRRNGKPDCVSAGGVFVQDFDQNQDLRQTALRSVYEVGSTSQRGELLALLAGLDYVWSAKTDTSFVTDSEYLFNAMTKEWFNNWANKGWITALGEPVKNRDLWEAILHSYRRCMEANIDITFYYIKGHCIPFGVVTAKNALALDETGKMLHELVNSKYDKLASEKLHLLEHANDLSERNNGFRLEPETLKRFVVSNLVADAVATKCVDAADALESRRP